jgi:hypothetical protein
MTYCVQHCTHILVRGALEHLGEALAILCALAHVLGESDDAVDILGDIRRENRGRGTDIPGRAVKPTDQPLQSTKRLALLLSLVIF